MAFQTNSYTFGIARDLRKRLNLPGLGQVGFVVRDVKKTAEYYRQVFSIGPWIIIEGETVACENRGKPVTILGKVGMAQVGHVQFELIQILRGEESIHREFLNERGEGLHHVGFFIRNLDARLKVCEEAGIQVLQKGTLKQAGLTIKYAYLDTAAIGGVVFEYIEPRLAGVPVSMRPWLMKAIARFSPRS